MSRIAVIGAGFSGAVIAQEMAVAGHEVVVFEARDHIGGNCYTYRDFNTGITVQKYGAHIFHTDKDRVWDYVRRFGEFMPYIHRVKADVDGKVYSLPINLHTINQFWGFDLTPEAAKLFIGTKRRAIEKPQNFEEQALSMIGPELYEAFLKGYTEKQWGRKATEIPADILRRLPLRFNYDDNYFFHPHQGLPKLGYTEIIKNMLNHPNIRVYEGTRANPRAVENFGHTFYSGPIDAWFGYKLGRLPYRTIDFTCETVVGDGLGCPVMNYPDASVPFTRKLEYKHFMPWRTYSKSLVYSEFSREAEPGDEPYYPIHMSGGLGEALISQYRRATWDLKHRVTFVGRLGTFRYMDMDVSIYEALAHADRFLGRE